MKLSDLKIKDRFSYGSDVYEPGDEARLVEMLRAADIPGLVAIGAIEVNDGTDARIATEAFAQMELADLQKLAKLHSLGVIASGDPGPDGRPTVRKIDVIDALVAARVGPPPAAASSAPTKEKGAPAGAASSSSA
jgi:hypothetical protein